MTGTITANVVMASSNISLDEAISSDPDNENIIFSIKNHELLEFSHVYESGTIFGKKTTTLPKIKIEILDSVRIYDPRLLGINTNRSCYFYYGVGDNPKDWAGPILGFLDPMKIVYGTFASGKRTFILEFWPIVPTHKILGDAGQKTTTTSFFQIPVFSFSSGKGGSPGTVSFVGDFHQNVEKLLVNYIQSIYTSDTEVLTLFPDFDAILQASKNILRSAANNSVPADVYKQKKWTSSELQTMYREALQSMGFTVTTSEEPEASDPKIKDSTFANGKIYGVYGGPANRQNLESAKQQADSSKTVMYISLTKEDSENYEARIKRFFLNISRMYDSPGSPYIGVESNLAFVKKITKAAKNPKKETGGNLTGTKPIVIFGDSKLVFNFLHCASIDSPNFKKLSTTLSNTDKSIYTREFMRLVLYKNQIDVTDTIFDHKDSQNSTLPVFKIGEKDPNVLDIKIDLNVFAYYALTNIWTGIANVMNSTHNKVGNSQDNYLKSLIADIDSVMQKSFEGIVASLVKILASSFNLPSPSLPKDIKKFYSQLQKTILTNSNLPWKKLLSQQVPWFLTHQNKHSFATLAGFELQKASYDGTIRTPPFFRFNSPDLMAQGCYLIYKDPIFSGNEKGSELANVFTGKYYVRGFKHTITSTGAFSEFTIMKMPEGGESPILES